ncbi:LppU/SCO3897 family protein [Salinispora fenicalii]|uniref:LppU/SCO3897 family protein n=1 Tax=Salinispora fenicalii TaxID=1137263 RepID=UPI0004B4D020|nr:hypothetical protein [Salinispora fenicalii]
MPPAPPKRSGGRIVLIIGLTVLLALFPCLGLTGWAAWKLSTIGDRSSESPSSPSTARDRAQNNSTGWQNFARGDCVVNDGTGDHVRLRKVGCSPNTYRVLQRIPATTDSAPCQTLAPLTNAVYVHDNPEDALDFVLCLRKY